MDKQKPPLKITAVRFVRAVGIFMNSEVKGRARLMLAGLVILFCGINALNVANSYVGRNFMTAIADRQSAEFVRQAIFYIAVFAAATVVSVFARFTEERLALLWREFLTRRAVNHYLADAAYYRLDHSGQLTHPDQRIADDIRVFTVTTLSFVLLVFNSGLTILAFSGVLWSISPLLFVVAVLYAACGSFLTIAFGRPLIRLNYDQLDKEAGFRSGLIHVREKAEAILVSGSEKKQSARLLQRLDDAISNFRQITAINRNVGFFTTGYNWLIQIIPALIVAPAFMRGDIAFGVITQSASAFALLVGAFSLIVTQFQSISNFAAVVARLSSLLEAIERSQAPGVPAIEIAVEEKHLAFEHLTLLSSPDNVPLLKDLSVSVPDGARILIAVDNPATAVALLKATAGIPLNGSGQIVRPGPGNILFLPQQPYLIPGTLRQVLVPPDKAGDISEHRIAELLQDFGLDRVIGQAGGLDVEHDWSALLSLREQQLLAFVGILLAAPRFAWLDRIDATLGADQLRKILHSLSEQTITCVHASETDVTRDPYAAVLECREDGSWTWTDNRG
ncbi:ABC transporter [Rhizobium sp. AC44/96]|uniref:ABC transporter ATP-binding protein/permease n=1 Tax=unclassified Rhizobium TaxID=2613769 RepID=UPI00080FFDA3|nr:MULTISPECIES: SbmA/BacA-like family transporter [unclassified Rhizobium]MDM9622846.1 SbmA/BacA-like family transporter [Rhizobium sp. S96]OCJ13247.1 ABC transporter [Rhizobium sp. AC44/96]